jgi:tetratricopeptide (TPR) repeat protein
MRRANVRVARKDYTGAIADYTAALRLAPLADDVWVTLLNRGSVYEALGRLNEALDDLQRAVTLSKADRYTLLGRGGIYHSLGDYAKAADDYGAVVTKFPSKVEPFWVRYALDLFEKGDRLESIGIARRAAGKFDIEPECNLAVCSLLWRDGSDADKSEALSRWKFAPLDTKKRMAAFDTTARDWPPSTRESAKQFLEAMPPLE